MRTCRSFFLLATAALLLSACGSQNDVPSYSLPADYSTRIYQGTEQASYVVTGKYHSLTAPQPVDMDGEITLSWRASDKVVSAIPALAGISLLSEQWNSDIYNGPAFFLQRQFWQQNDGLLVYAGFTLQAQGAAYWASVTGQSQPSTGITTIGGPTPGSIQLNYDLHACDASSCTGPVATVSETYAYQGIENIKTHYANFETLRFGYQLNISGISSNQLDLSISGPIWIYPPLGPVRFSWLISTPDDFTEFSMASLVSTNIPLPPADQ